VVLLKLKYSNNWTRAILRNLFSLKPITNYYNKFKYLPPTGINFNLLSNIFQHFMNQLERAPPPTKINKFVWLFPKNWCKMEAKVNQHPPTHHGGRRMNCIWTGNKFLVIFPSISYVMIITSIYIPSNRQVPFPLTYLHNNHLHPLPTHLWYTYPPTFIGSYLCRGKGK
jgi:hypothetical protein